MGHIDVGHVIEMLLFYFFFKKEKIPRRCFHSASVCFLTVVPFQNAKFLKTFN